MLSEISKEILRMMNGMEIWSQEYEGCVGVEGNKVIRDGKKVDTLNTNKKIDTLWNEYIENEGI